jgi:F-box and WD-40 domain protein CDC4
MASQTQTLYIPFASPPTPCPSPSPDPHAIPSPARRHYLSAFLHACTPAELLYISDTITPLLKRDFLAALPPEIAVYILNFIDDPLTLVRASMVSRSWRRLVADEWIWLRMCRVWEFVSEEDEDEAVEEDAETEEEPLEEMEQYAELTMDPALEWLTARKRKARRVNLGGADTNMKYPRPLSYKDHFKDAYITSTLSILNS